MIVDQDIKPEKQAYLIGAELLGILSNESEIVNPFTLYESLNQQREVSYHAFSMGMNWLFLIGALELKDSKIIKCI